MNIEILRRLADLHEHHFTCFTGEIPRKYELSPKITFRILS